MAGALLYYLRAGGLTISIAAVQAGDNGDEISDAALRQVGAELQMRVVQGRRVGAGASANHRVLPARRVERAPPKRNPGRYAWYDDWYRNLAICFLIQLTCAEYGASNRRVIDNRGGAGNGRLASAL